MKSPDQNMGMIAQSPEHTTHQENPLKDKLLSVLEKDGISRESSEGLIFDVDRFQKKEYLDAIYNRTIALDKKDTRLSREIIFQNLSDLNVISTEDFEKSRREGAPATVKPLFYIPENIDAAFDLKTIKNREAHLNPWDIFQTKNWDMRIHLKDSGQIGLGELYFATRILEDFQARRSAEGKLEMFDDDMGQFVRPSVKWLKGKIGSIGGSEKGFDSSVHKFLVSFCPNLLTRGIIRLDDFQIQGNEKGNFLVRKEFEFSKSSGTDFSYSGVRYYIGRENFIFQGVSYPKRNLKIALLDSQTAGIISGNRIISIFKLLSHEKKQEKHSGIKKHHTRQLNPQELSSRTIVSQKEMRERLRPWLRTEDNPRHTNETAEQYAERLSLLGDYDYLQKISRDFSERLGIGIHHKLTWREQQWLSAAAYDLDLTGDYERLITFAKKFGSIGLKTFLTCEFDVENGKKILEMGKNLSEIDAMRIFQKVGEIIDLAENKKQEIAKIVYEKADSDMEQDVREKLLRRANEIIIAFSDAREKDTAKLLADLENTKTEIIMLSALLKTAKEKGEKVDFEQIRNLKVERKKIGEKDEKGEEVVLSKDEKKQLEKMFEANYAIIFKDNPEAYEEVVGEFKKELYSQKNFHGQICYILKYGEDIIGFSRFKPSKTDPNEVEAKSFNVHQEVKGCKLGEFFSEAYLAEMSEKYSIRAKTREDNPANGMYRKQGFEFLDKFKNPETGVKYWDVRMKRKKEEKKEEMEYDKAA